MLTITTVDCVKVLRQKGMRVSEASLIAAFESGELTFGRVISVGPTGRRTVRIFRADFYTWLHDMLSRGQESASA